MKKTILKTLVFSLMMALCFVMPLRAQSDGFFRGGNDSYDNRGQIDSNTTNGITNNGIGQSEVPLGSGLLIMVAAGAGYAVARRKRNRNGMTMLLALALLFGMTQCKKNVDTINHAASASMHITLTVDGGSRVSVDPTNGGNNNYASVTFQEGDVIYVGDGAQLIGTLSFASGAFSGNIDNSSLNDSDYLHFYFLGNKLPYETVTVGATTLSVNIIDQTSEYPVISYAPSKETFGAGAGHYTARLFNHCAIQKFTSNVDKVIKIKGMKNKVILNFASTTTPYSYDVVSGSEGAIVLHRESAYDGSGVYVSWGILCPQPPVTAASATAAGYGTESTFDVHEIDRNGYYNTAINISLTQTGIIDGKFTINENGDKVNFSQGNLQYNKSTGEWSFMPYQYSIVERDDQNVGTDYENQNIVSLFGWGTSGYKDTREEASKYQTYIAPFATANTPVESTDPAYNINRYGYGPDSYYAINSQIEPLGLTVENKSDWGANPITNGGNTPGMWRTLGMWEWRYVRGGYRSSFTKCHVTSAKATVNGVDGMILFPDDWDTLYYKLRWYDGDLAYNFNPPITLSDWNTHFEAHGAVFLPAAGSRWGTIVEIYDPEDDYSGNCGDYWTSDPSWLNNNSTSLASSFYFSQFGNTDSYLMRAGGRSVRLVTTPQ